MMLYLCFNNLRNQTIVIKKILLLLIVFGVSITNHISAQQEYSWEEYGIGFSLADDFKETVNSMEEFSAVGDGMELSIIPFKDNSIDDSDINAYTMSIAASLKLEKIDDISTIEINGFKGGYAEGVQNGVKIFVMGLIEPNSETNFFVMIVFQENDENAVEEAISICQSIHKI